MSEKLTKSAQAVLNYLQEHAENGNISIEHGVLAFCLHVNEKTVRRALEQLQKVGHIRTESGKEEGTANTYFLTSYVPAPVMPKPAMKAIPYSKPAVAMAKMRSKNGKPDTITGILSIECNGVKLQIKNFADIVGCFSLNTHKLFCAGLIQFTNNNNIGDKSDKINCGVAISLKEYAAMCGYDVEEHQTDNPAKEKQRVKNLLKYVRKQVALDLEILYTSSLTWSENTNKKSKDYLDIRIITDKGIKNGYIYMKFNDSFANYLKLRRLTQYPLALFSVDARSANAYRIGQAMSFHYNNDNNLKSNTANRMKISTLLEYTDLPTISEIQKGEHSWTERIKEPFETALDELYRREILSDWWYCRSGDIVLTDSEAQNFPDFETWKNMLIHFEISQATDHSLRLAIKEEKKDKPEVKRKRTKTKKAV